MSSENINKGNKNRKRKAENIEENIPNTMNNICLKLSRDFFNVPCIDLAKSLLGKNLMRRLDDNSILKGKIVETESYLGGIDKGSKSYNGRRTEANEPMYMIPGTAYVYMTYGMYYCFNISSREPGAAVLLRAVAPLEGHEQMNTNRKTPKRKKELKDHELCNGPSKLCMSFKITKQNNKLDLCSNEEMWIENESEDEHFDIIEAPRIGIESAGEEWAKKPLRFYILNNKCVSKRDKNAEIKFNKA